MKTISVQLPDSVDEKEAQEFLAAQLYGNGMLSLGQGANMTGMNKEQFMQLLSKYQISIFDYTEAELHAELRNVKNYRV